MKKKNKFIFLATLSTACLLSLASCQGAQGDKGDKGDPGINGTDGKNGIDGKDGQSLLNGKGVPASSTGNDGDSYIDTESFDFYVKESGTWVKKGNLKGSSDGTKGEDGTSIRTGKGVPSDTLGKDGDSYIDTESFDFYVKASGKWSKEGNIKGEKGSNGSNGSNGADGKTAWSNTILPSNGGYVTVDKGSATSDQQVTFTIVPSDDNVVTYFSLDGGKSSAFDQLKPVYEDEKITNKMTCTVDMQANGYVVKADFGVKQVRDSNGNTYESLNAAFTNASSDLDLTLLKDVTLSSDITIEHATKIELNGHKINFSTYKITVDTSKGGSLSITNNGEETDIEGSGTSIIKVTGNGGSTGSRNSNPFFGGLSKLSRNTILSTAKASEYALSIGGKVKVKSTNTTSESKVIEVASGKVEVVGSVESSNGSALTVTGGEVKVSKDAKVTATGSGSAIDVQNGKIEVTGTVSSSTGSAVKAGAGSEVVVKEDAKVEATGETGKAVEVSGGSLTVSGTVSSKNGVAIDSQSGSVEVKATATVEATGTGTAVTVSGTSSVTVSGKVSSENGTAVEVKGGSLEVKKEEGSIVTPTVSGKENGVKVSSGKVTVSDATVSAESSTGAAINVEKTSGSSVNVAIEGSSTIKNENSDGTTAGNAIKESSTGGSQGSTDSSSTITVDKNTSIKGTGYDLTISDDSVTGGSISSNEVLTNVAAGKSITFKVIVSDNYLFKGVTLTKKDDTSAAETVNNGVYDKANGTYTMIMPAYSCTVKGVFASAESTTVVIDEKGNQYSSFEAAVTQSNKDNIDHTYTLHSDCTLTSNVEFSKNNVTLDLNGKTLNLGNNTLSVTSGSLTIKGSYKSTSDTAPTTDLIKATATDSVLVKGNGKLTIDGVGLEASHWGFNNAGGTLEIKDAYVKSVEASVVTQGKGNTLIEKGNFNASDNFVLGTQGTSGNGKSTITVNGGTFNGQISSSGYIACGVYAANDDTWNINGGTFNITGGVGICARSGVINVAKDVKINCTSKEGLTEGKVGDSKIDISIPHEIVIDKISNYPGGEAIVNNNTSYTPVTIKAVSVKSSSGTISYYDTLQEAYDACNAGDTIKLGKNITMDDRLVISKNLTLDLGGHTVTGVKNDGTDTTKLNSADNGYQVFRVDGNHDSNPEVTIKNGTVDATKITQESGDYPAGPKNECDAIAAMYGGIVTIENLNVKVNSATGACFFARSNTTDTASKKSKITIKSGTFENKTTVTYPYNSAEKAMVLNQGDQIKNEALISVEGGTFIGNSPANGDKNASVTTFVATGYTVETVTEGSVTKYVVKASSSN